MNPFADQPTELCDLEVIDQIKIGICRRLTLSRARRECNDGSNGYEVCETHLKSPTLNVFSFLLDCMEIEALPAIKLSITISK